jgi:glycosyltransferase involved in cell wall biosynthesis
LVLTVNARYHAAHDTTRLADVVGAHVWPTGEVPNPRQLALAARRTLRRSLHALGVSSLHPTEPADLPFEVKDAEAPGIRARLRRLLLSLCWLPDANLGWLPLAVQQGLRIVREERPRAILTTSPPHTAHLVGLWLARITGLPWLADFRDPWVANPGKPRFVRTGLSDAFDRRMERTVVRRARAVVVTTDPFHARLAEQYPGEAPAKFITIPNGFDPDDFATLPPPGPSDRFLVTHVGSLYYRRSVVTFLHAAAALIQSGEIPRADLRIALVGGSPEDGQDVRTMVEILGLSSAVEWVGNVAQREALAWMRRSSLLLLFAQQFGLQIPAKTFEYLASGTPILAITEEGPTADLVTRLGGFVAPDTVAEITLMLRRCYRAHRAVSLARPATPWNDVRLREFDRRGIAAKFATLLDEIVQRA